MNIPKEAIKKAIASGWRPAEDWEDYKGIEQTDGMGVVFSFRGRIKDTEDPNYGQTYGSRLHILFAQIALDPFFWQALGKSLGWHDQPYLCPGCQTIGTREGNHMKACPRKYRYGSWRDEAIEFCELVYASGDTDAYWKDLLK